MSYKDLPERLREAAMWQRHDPTTRQALLDAAKAIAQRDEQIERLLAANEHFAARQGWWNERMFELEQQREALRAKIEKLKKVLASSCDEQRYELWEAGPGIGGCERAVDAEREVRELQTEVEALRAKNATLLEAAEWAALCLRQGDSCRAEMALREALYA